MWRRVAVGSALLVAASSLAQTPEDEASIKARIAAHGRASAAGDAGALSEVYADDAELVSASGAVTRGRQAIVAIVDVGSQALGGRDSTGTALPSADSSLLTVWRRDDGVWRVVYQRPVPAPRSPK